MARRGNRGGPSAVLAALALPLLWGCPRSDAPPPVASPVRPPSAAGLHVGVVDAEDRPLPEGRIALPGSDAFDAQGRLRADVIASSPDRLRVVVEDSGPGAPSSVVVQALPSGPALTLPLSGPANRRLTPPFVLLADPEDAAASQPVLRVAPGARLEVRYRDAVAAELRVGPSVIHEIPVRVTAAGPFLPADPEFERCLDLRLQQANAVWEPLGRRFVRAGRSTIGSFGGLVLIRGRAAGVDAQGRPSHSGLKLEGRDVLIPCPWRDDGAPLTPKAAARALIEKAGKTLQADLFDGLAGDREAVVIRWRRRDGAPAAVEALPASNDVAQSVSPLAVDLVDGVEVAPSGAFLSLEEASLLASGKSGPTDGFHLFVVADLHSLYGRPAFKVFPEGQFSSLLAGSAIVSWSIVDGSGRYPYALARVLGELLMPPSLRPGPDDTLFAEPLSQSPAVDARKRISAATGNRIAERGRGLSSRK